MHDKSIYRLGSRPVGTGGQAEVFKATEKTTNNVFAFKRILAKRDKEALARMRREIEVQSEISHSNVMPILDYSLNYHWYTMPLANRRLEDITPPLQTSLLIKIIEDSAKGLREAHEKHFIHRDLKPSNIMEISSGDSPTWVVADWGLVRMHGNTTQNRTPSGQEIGTAAFAAPELWVNAHNADERADIYSLGRVVCWCLGRGTDLIPNVKIDVEGIWREFVYKTTMNEPKDRPVDMNEVFKLMDRIKQTLALPPSSVGMSVDGNCPRCGYGGYALMAIQGGREVEIRRCTRCDHQYSYIVYY